MRRRRRLDTITEGGSASGGSSFNLPLAGPFAGNAAVDYRGLSNLNVDGTLFVTSAQTRTNPLKYNHITFNDSTSLIRTDYSTTNSVYIWANTLQLSTPGCGFGAIIADGQTGSDGITDCFGHGLGGNGGTGAGGGGGGAATKGSCGCCGYSGGNGGTGTSGGAGGCGCGTAGAGGIGLPVTDGYAYNLGGAGGYGGGIADCDGRQSTWGNGIVGGGGGGGGGAAQGACAQAGAGGGGGGGAGKIVIVVKQLIGNFYNISAQGGGGGALANSAGGGGGGGGGVVLIYAQSYDGHLLANVQAGYPYLTCGGNQGGIGTDGSARIFKINHDGSPGAESTFATSWNNI